MSHKIEIIEKENEIRGLVDNHVVIMLYNSNEVKQPFQTKIKAGWNIGTSSCLPVDLGWAEAYVQVMTECINRVNKKIALEKK